jgi:hypothetical protein
MPAANKIQKICAACGLVHTDVYEPRSSRSASGMVTVTPLSPL